MTGRCIVPIGHVDTAGYHICFERRGHADMLGGFLIYAHLRAADVGLSVEPADAGELGASASGDLHQRAVSEETTMDDFDAVIPAVTGMAYRYGASRFTVDPRDPLVPGFVLR